MTTGEDKHVHLNTSGGAVNGRSTSSDVDGISCCWDESDLCYIREVVAEGGQIIKHTSGTSYTLEDVSTHRSRYDLCRENSELIYCQVDPEGDAFTEPLPAISLQDCHDRFARSPASRSCDEFHANAQDGRNAGTGSERRRIALDDEMCHAISARCPAGSGDQLTIDEALPLADVRRLKFCEWDVTAYIWNRDFRSFVRDNVEQHQQLQTDRCPRSTETYQDSNGNFVDRADLEDAAGSNRTTKSLR